MYHMHLNHPRAKTTEQKKHFCKECSRGFRLEESLESHKKAKHGPNSELPTYFCKDCYVDYYNEAGIESHNQNIYHTRLIEFMVKLNKGETLRLEVKEEPEEVSAVVKTHEFEQLVDEEEEEKSDDESMENGNESTDRMSTRNSSIEPVAKRLRLMSLPVGKVQSRMGIDKLEYLEFLIKSKNGFKCKVCGIEKTVRKHLIRHLKDHDEVPTFKCPSCPEKFVFKKKFDEHLLTHSQSDVPVLPGAQQDDSGENPQLETTEKNEIKCQICQLPFKLTIMLNRHNNQWHGESNPLKHLTADEQKSKKNEPELSVIKLMRCKLCNEAFIKPGELEDHHKQKHNSEDDDQMDTNEQSSGGSFACDKCKCVYEEEQFLENHKKMFCIHRQGAKSDQVIIEQ